MIKKRLSFNSDSLVTFTEGHVCNHANSWIEFAVNQSPIVLITMTYSVGKLKIREKLPTPAPFETVNLVFFQILNGPEFLRSETLLAIIT